MDPFAFLLCPTLDTARQRGPSVSARSNYGTVGFDCPDKRDVHAVHIEPLLVLSVEDGACTSLDWGSAGMLAIGLSNGETRSELLDLVAV